MSCCLANAKVICVPGQEVQPSTQESEGTERERQGEEIDVHYYYFILAKDNQRKAKEGIRPIQRQDKKANKQQDKKANQQEDKKQQTTYEYAQSLCLSVCVPRFLQPDKSGLYDTGFSLLHQSFIFRFKFDFRV